MGVLLRRLPPRSSWAGISAGRHGPSGPQFCSRSIKATSNSPWHSRPSSSSRRSSWRSCSVGCNAPNERLRIASTPRIDGRSDPRPRRPARRGDGLADVRVDRACNPPELALAQVDVVLEARPLLPGVDLSLPRSSFVVVLGPTGAGKTTILRLLLGLERPSAGKALVGGREWATLSRSGRARNRQRTGHLQQHVRLLKATAPFDV